MQCMVQCINNHTAESLSLSGILELMKFINIFLSIPKVFVYTVPSDEDLLLQNITLNLFLKK